MAGPPTDIPADELWARIVQSDQPNERPFEEVDFPRKDKKTGEPLGKLAIWPLKENELIIAKAEATRSARAYIKEKFDATEHVEGYKQVFEDLCASEFISRFARRIDNRSVAAFPNAQKVREHLTGDEMSVLVNAYALVQVKLGPIVSYMTDADFDAWVARLAEGGSATPLALLSWEQRTALLMHSVSQLHALRTVRSLPGESQDEPTTSAAKSNETVSE